MITLLTLALLSTRQPAPATRADAAERTIRLESVWIDQKDSGRRAQAVGFVNQSVMAFFGGQYGRVCEGLDRASATLLGRQWEPADAVRVRFQSSAVAPGSTVKAVVSWAYSVPVESVVSISVGSEKRTLKAGESTTLEWTAPDAEGDYPIDIELEASSRSLILSVVSSLDERIGKLTQAELQPLVAALRATLAGTYEMSLPVHEWLNKAEDSVKPESNVVAPMVQHGSTVFRVAIPRGVEEKPTVIIALHGAGGSENMFFDGYGAGAIRKMAEARGWIFMSPRTSAAAPQACLDWLRETRDIEPERVFLVGHSMGGGAAVSAVAQMKKKPAGVALFAPASGPSLPVSFEGVPVFLAVGEQEMAMLKTTADRLGASLANRAASKFVTYPNCEHLMVVVEGRTDLFDWLDGLVGE